MVVGVARLSLNDLIIPTSIYREQVMLELTRIYYIKGQRTNIYIHTESFL